MGSGFSMVSVILDRSIAAIMYVTVTRMKLILVPASSPYEVNSIPARRGDGVVDASVIIFMIEYPVPRFSWGIESMVRAEYAGPYIVVSARNNAPSSMYSQLGANA